MEILTKHIYQNILKFLKSNMNTKQLATGQSFYNIIPSALCNEMVLRGVVKNTPP